MESPPRGKPAGEAAGGTEAVENLLAAPVRRRAASCACVPDQVRALASAAACTGWQR